MPSYAIQCLLIDDNYYEHEFFERALKKINAKIECTYYSSGENALCRLNNPAIDLPHLIFVDINMPRLNGIEFLIQLKLSDRLSEIPVYIYSAVDDFSYIERAIELGVAGHIVKTSNTEELHRALNGVFQILAKEG
jgi:DNA-binding NarL/FixJ family response regulator